MNHSSTDS